MSVRNTVKSIQDIMRKDLGVEVKARNYDLDFKNPYTVVDDHVDPDELLTRLDEAERQATTLRDQLKAIQEEALLR